MSSQQFIFSNDPYEKFIKNESFSKNLIANDRSSKFSRKFKAFKNDLILKKTYFIYGGMQGFAIGCLAGLGIGMFSAFQAKRFIIIPISMVSSGLFFGCVMAFGSIIRTVDTKHMINNQEKPVEISQIQQYKLVEHIQKSNFSLLNTEL